jgi:hypothetical protein
MKQVFMLGVGLLAATALASEAVAALPGKVVGRSAASGRVALATAQADVRRPKAIYVRLDGEKLSTATVVVVCVRSFSGSSVSYSRTEPGLYRLPIKPAGADSCRVNASAGGTGRILIEVRIVR